MREDIKPKTTWAKIMLTAYTLAFVFSTIAVILTVYELKSNYFLSETSSFTKSLFLNYGLTGGSILYVAYHLFLLIAIPISMLSALKLIEREIRYNLELLSLFLIAIIEGVGIASISTSFLDMTNDLIILNYLSNSSIGSVILNLGWLRALTDSMWIPVFLFFLMLSFSIRSIRLLKKNNQTKIEK